MSGYVIHTDSACDIAPSLLCEWGVGCTNLTFRFNGEDKEYENGEMPIKDFYNRMREGGVAKTSAPNVGVFKEAFEKYLSEGLDILYIGFSTGLSTTYNSGRIAAEELSEKYPERKIFTIDTRSASAGFGLLVNLAVKKKAEGKTIDEVKEYIEETAPYMCHWFTVDDLVYLKRGGRISAATAIVGNMLGIKPVLHMDEAGHLISMSKVRGRRASIMALADKYGELHDATKDGTVYISHGDCDEDVETLKTILFEKYGATVELVSYVGTVIGAHSGPKTLALFFIGKER